MTSTRHLLERVASGRLSAEDARSELARIDEAKRAKRKRTAPKRAERVAKQADRQARASGFYATAKIEAAARSADHIGPRCEGPSTAPGGPRCGNHGQDPDHVLGGSMRRECERLGAEGLMVLCRYHHDLKHAATPTRGYWLDVAEEHAIRHGYRRLLSLVARARAKYEGKHPQSPETSR